MNRIYITAAILSLLATASCRQEEKKQVTEQFALTDTMLARTEFAKAGMQPLSSGLKLYGKVTAPNSRLAEVYPAVGGSVVKVNVDLGDYVKQGQVLAVIRSGEVAEYERQRIDADNDVAIAEKNHQVMQDMYSGKLASEKDLLLSEKELQKAKASRQRISEVFKIYSLGQGATYNVTAPLSGFVVDKDITENMQLRSDNAESLFAIAQISEVWVIANVNESDISKVTPGTEALIHTISYPDRVFKGKVDKILNVLDETTKAMKVRIVIPNEDLALKPEMSATVSLIMKQNKSMIAVPSSAVIFDKSKNWVMVYKDKNNIETRPVEVYSQFGDTTYLRSGVKEGETVISKNQLLIYNALNN